MPHGISSFDVGRRNEKPLQVLGLDLEADLVQGQVSVHVAYSGGGAGCEEKLDLERLPDARLAQMAWPVVLCSIVKRRLAFQVSGVEVRAGGDQRANNFLGGGEVAGGEVKRRGAFIVLEIRLGSAIQ